MIKLKKLIINLMIASLCLSVCGCSTKGDYNNMENLKIQIVNQADVEEFTPSSFHEDVAKEKGLTLFDEEYLQLQAAYLALLNLYLVEEAGLDEYQKKLDEGNYNFVEIDDEDKDIYFKNGSFGRKNLYIRNNIHVELLSKEDIQILREAVKKDTVEVSEEIMEMIKRTMKDVIKIYFDDPDNKFVTIYDMGVFQRNEAPNTALVLQIKYEFEYDEKGNIINKDKENEKLEYLEKFKKELEKEMSGKLDMPVVLFY